MRFIQPNIVLYFFLLILGISAFFLAVIWPQSQGFYAFITFAAVGGFGTAFYICRTKKQDKQLTCPVGSDCNAVVTSRYAAFLGIPLEYWGMAYYGIIALSYVGLVFLSNTLPDLFLSGLFLLTLAAFFFSLYLLFVQGFLLRQWCIWCLLSAMLSIAIFIVSLASIDAAVAILREIAILIEFVHTLGLVLGLGGATTAFILFSRFLRDFDIDEDELRILKGTSELIWFGLLLTLVSQFAFFVSYPQALASSGPFVVQTAALFVVALSGAVLMILFTPFLALIPFRDPAKGHSHSPLAPLRKPLFITGAVGLSSWYVALSMTYMPQYSITPLVLIYVAILVLSALTALVWEKKMGRGAR